ncbi:MAG: immunoglobulin domain-containing protein, partial [Candidatus Latescibacteria bacterium]|nr:immunoglobulin domain-containing protein [Candidatus Latescibacterota bacterium]
MDHSYTPGLRVSDQAIVRCRRVLPLKGSVLVGEGDTVSHDEVVARTELPGDVTIVNAVGKLGIDPSELSEYLLKKEGDTVELDEVIAQTKPFISWFKQTLKSPITGTLESVSSVTGQLILRDSPRPVEVTAYVDGTVAEMLPGDGVEIETVGAFIQGIFGVGGEAWGPLIPAVDSPEDDLDPDRINEAMAGAVVIGGAMASSTALKKAISVGAAGVITGGIHDEDLRELLGYDLGVAITGNEEIGTTIVVTEGFGRIAMAHRTFDILQSCCGEKVASINGATQIRAGVLRPEIIVPDPDRQMLDHTEPAEIGGLEVGAPVRAIREPFFGWLGHVTSLPAELIDVDSEARVRVLEVEFDGGETAVVPRANIES